MLAHIDRRIDSGDGAALNECLLKVFVLTLLPAHESKFTQFLVFHACAREAAAKATSPGASLGGQRRTPRRERTGRVNSTGPGRKC